MKVFNLFVGLAALLPFALAAPAQADDMVLTPGGLRPKSNVIQIPEGGSINLTATEIHLLDASKNIIHVAQRGDGRIGPFTDGGPEVPAQTGWISWTQWHRNANPINQFWSSWVVPPNPVTNHGQTIFLFNGLEPDPGNAILQPVLQWGPSSAGGGPFWQIATWYVSDTIVFFTQLVSVSPGQGLQGILELTAINGGGTFNYLSGFANIGSAVALSNSPELTWAFETLEAYGIVTPATDYPTGCTQFNGIGLTTTAGVFGNLLWGVVNDGADGLSTSVVVNGANGNGAVNICYPIR
ncbi:hypothetical protein L218DRAFT_1015021 [Marasmius fiardii PR-910]|nr:hypothetical protein L218DRAFT_1015021 [Marasmius fiardii PR-910]